MSVIFVVLSGALIAICFWIPPDASAVDSVGITLLRSQAAVLVAIWFMLVAIYFKEKTQ